MNKRLIIFVNFLAVLIVLAGCASNPPISSLTAHERERVSSIVFIKSGEIPKDSYKVLGSVEGLACKRNLYAYGTPSVEEARQGVRIRAAQLGANAVINVLCEENLKVDWVRNCWQSVVCVGDAIVVDDPTIIQRIGEQGKTKLPDTVSTGTGWVVEPGFIVTNHHVIKGATDILGHLEDGRSLKLSVVAAATATATVPLYLQPAAHQSALIISLQNPLLHEIPIGEDGSYVFYQLQIGVEV